MAQHPGKPSHSAAAADADPLPQSLEHAPRSKESTTRSGKSQHCNCDSSACTKSDAKPTIVPSVIRWLQERQAESVDEQPQHSTLSAEQHTRRQRKQQAPHATHDRTKRSPEDRVGGLDRRMRAPLEQQQVHAQLPQSDGQQQSKRESASEAKQHWTPERADEATYRQGDADASEHVGGQHTARVQIPAFDDHQSHAAARAAFDRCRADSKKGSRSHLSMTMVRSGAGVCRPL